MAAAAYYDDDVEIVDGSDDETVIAKPRMSFRNNNPPRILPCYECGEPCQGGNVVRFSLHHAPRGDPEAIYAVRHRSCRLHFVVQ